MYGIFPRWTQSAVRICTGVGAIIQTIMDMYRMFGIFLWDGHNSNILVHKKKMWENTVCTVFYGHVGGHNCSILVHKKMWENTVRTVFFERDIIPEWIHRLHSAGRTQTQVEIYRMYGIFFQMGTIWSIWCWCFFRQTQFAAYGIGAKQACRLNTILKHTARTVAHSKAVLKSTVRTVFFLVGHTIWRCNPARHGTQF